MRPVRLQHTYELLRAYGAFEDESSMVIFPRPASTNELASFHNENYIEAVRQLSNGQIDAIEGHGFSNEGDNPIYVGMYDAALLVAGASVQAAELIADGTVGTAFAPSGGLHHAMPGWASGFCIFNPQRSE